MDQYPYLGMRPHIKAAAESAGADWLKVERLEAMKRLEGLLCQVPPYLRRNEPDKAKGILEAARKYLADLDAAAEAAHAAFDEVEAMVESIIVTPVTVQPTGDTPDPTTLAPAQVAPHPPARVPGAIAPPRPGRPRGGRRK
jgi:hypothetical protein